MLVDVDLRKRKKINRKVGNIAYLWNFLKIGFTFLITWGFMFACFAKLEPVKKPDARHVKEKHVAHYTEFEENNTRNACLPVKIRFRNYVNAL